MTGLIILLKIGFKSSIFCPMWPWKWVILQWMNGCHSSPYVGWLPGQFLWCGQAWWPHYGPVPLELPSSLRLGQTLIAFRDGDFRTCHLVHGLCVAKQCQPGPVPGKHHYRVWGGAAWPRSADRQCLQGDTGQLHLPLHVVQYAWHSQSAAHGYLHFTAHLCILAKAPRSSRATGRCRPDTTRLSGQFFMISTARSWMAFQFSFHSPKNCIMVTFRLGLKDCIGWVMLTSALSLLMGWRDQEAVLLVWGNTRLIVPSAPKWDTMDSLYMHADLSTDAHMVGNIRNCLLCAEPMEEHFHQVMCYKPWWLDWLPMHWTEFKHVHVVIPDSHDQKVQFDGKATAEVERQIHPDLRNRDMVASITPYAGTWYQWGEPCQFFTCALTSENVTSGLHGIALHAMHQE